MITFIPGCVPYKIPCIKNELLTATMMPKAPHAVAICSTPSSMVVVGERVARERSECESECQARRWSDE